MSNNNAVPTTTLGTGGPVVGIQGLGCMGMSDFYGETDTAEALATLDRALELGVTFFDTADMYGFGENEKLIGPFVRANRDRVVVATKFSIERRIDDPTYRAVRNDPAYIRQAVDASLSRLGVDVIDVYYMHRRNPEVPLAESVGAMGELVTAGKVKYLGLSEVTGAELREAHAVHPIAAVQSEWSLFSRDVETSLVGVAAALGVAVVPYSPLGRGFLTGAFQDASAELSSGDFRQYQPRFTGENAKRNADLLDPVRKAAKAHDATLGQIALAWVHGRAQAHGLTVVPIPGTRKAERVRENTAATRIQLSEQERDWLEPIAGQVAGDRYADMSNTSAARE
jgi:aryl-alcohol dehydrogenase-like predicted oxidoreductase